MRFGQDAFRLWHGGSGGRSDSRTPLFPDGLAAFLCLGFPLLVDFYLGGTLDIKRRRIKKRQDSESREPPDPVFVPTNKTRIWQILFIYRSAYQQHLAKIRIPQA